MIRILFVWHAISILLSQTFKSGAAMSKPCHKQIMNQTWKSHVKDMNKSWTNHGQVESTKS